MRITKDQLRNRVGSVHQAIDKLFRMDKVELMNMLRTDLPGADINGTRDYMLRMLIKHMIMVNFHPGRS